MEIINVVVSIIALIILEIVLGIDNLVFLSILTEKLPAHKRKKARQWGLTFAWVTRLLLLASAVYIVKLTKPLLVINTFTFSFRDLFLLLGGMFLIWKATEEIHQEMTDEDIFVEISQDKYVAITFRGVVLQVAIMDIIFSLDSVLTAVGLTDQFWIMGLAITIAIFIMIYASEMVSQFIHNHPTIKMLALGFLILIGMVLIADSLSFHIPRGYVYFAMGFSLAIESLNLVKKSRKKKRKK